MANNKLETAAFILKVLGGLWVIYAFRVGLKQYRIGQNWQKAQVILSLIDSFKEDEHIQAACLMIDWDQRDIAVNEQGIPFKNDMLIDALKVVHSEQHSGVTLDRAGLGGDSPMAGDFSPEQTAIRDSFDRFFDYFDKIHAFRQRGLIGISDITYFYYWFDLLQQIGTNKENQEIQKAVDAYIDTYRFNGYVALRDEYQAAKERPSSDEPAW